MTDHDGAGWRDVRPVALGVPWRTPGESGPPAEDTPPAERELLVEWYDLDERFCRPLGGGIEFGEGSAAAVRREFREETGYEVRVDGRLGVVETVFEFGGEPHHEVGVVYALTFADPAAYEREQIPVRESDGSERTASWHRLAALRERPEPLYPDGLGALLAGETDHVVSRDD
jgi:ADP-ribose pyrophosphatase YjhB (NUDIX family)